MLSSKCKQGGVAGNFQEQGNPSLLRRLLLLSAIIIIANFLIGLFAGMTGLLGDEILFFDALWRVTVGQRVGIDFHFALGIGPYELGALLWHWFGPHYYLMWLAVYLFDLVIVFCGCIVAARTLAHRTDLALLFCVTLAFQVSAPTVPNAGLTLLGIAEFYNRHISSALAVLFLQTFGGRSTSSRRDDAIEVALAACLLNIIFLVKISGLLLGLIILLAGCLLPGRTTNRLLNLSAAVLAFAAITVIQFEAASLEFLPIIHDYELAAQAQSGYHSFFEILGSLTSGPFLGSVTLLVLFAVSQRGWELRLRCIGLIFGTYAACQFALNVTNTGYPSMWLAPAAIASLAVRMGAKPAVQQTGAWKNWYGFAPSRFAEISAREAIPLLIFGIVLVPQIISSLAAVAFGTFVSLGIKTPYVVTAGNAISYRLQHPRLFSGPAVNDAVAAISSLNLGHETIANLDFSNPFPVLFLAPPPAGIQVYWDFDNNVPKDALLGWQDVIGDACVVTIPAQPYLLESRDRLVEIVRSKLATDFKIVYQDALWSIYRRTRDCTENFSKQTHFMASQSAKRIAAEE